MGEPRVSFTPFTLPWAEIPLPLQGATDSKPLNYRMYTIPLPNICHCAHLSLSFNKTGGGSAIPTLKSKRLAWYCARLSLSFNKTGGGSAIPTLKSKRLAWYCARLSLSFNKIGGGSAMSNKNKFSFATALAFHYLCHKIKNVMNSLSALYRIWRRQLTRLESILPNTEITLEGKQRQAVYFYGTFTSLLSILFTLSDMTGPSGIVFSTINLVSAIASLLLFIAYLTRHLKLTPALTSALLLTQTATLVENLICAFSPSSFHISLITANMMLSAIAMMLAVLAYLRWVPTIIAATSLLTFGICTLITRDEGLMCFLGVFTFIVVIVCILGERVIRNYQKLQSENSGLKSDERSLMMALRLNKKQVKAYIELSMVNKPNARDMEVFFDMAGDAVKRKLVTAVMDYLNKENCKRERVVSAFPELTPSEHEVCMLIVQGKKQSEICTLLNKTQTNISAHRGHIRKKLGLNPEDNLRDVLTERMKQQGKLSGFTPPYR